MDKNGSSSSRSSGNKRHIVKPSDSESDGEDIPPVKRARVDQIPPRRPIQTSTLANGHGKYNAHVADFESDAEDVQDDEASQAGEASLPGSSNDDVEDSDGGHQPGETTARPLRKRQERQDSSPASIEMADPTRPYRKFPGPSI